MAAAGAVFIMVVMMVMVLVFLVVVAAAMLTMLMMVMVLMLLVAMTTAMLAMLMVMMVLMLLMIVAAAMLAMLVVMVVLVLLMVVAAAMLAMLVVMMVLMLLMVMAAAVLTMLVVMVVLMLQLCQVGSQGSLAFHSLQKLSAGELIPGSGDHGCLSIVLPDQRHGSIQLGLGNGIGTGEDNGGGSLDLVVIELTEVLHINLYLACVSHSYGIAQGDLIICNLVHSGDHIGQFAHTGGLDDDPVRIIFSNYLGQSLAEVTHQTAANAARVHLGDVNARILQEAAVDTDLTELILDEYQLLARIGFGNHFLDEGRLARTEKTGININFSHKNTFCCKLSNLLYHRFRSVTSQISMYFRHFSLGFALPVPVSYSQAGISPKCDSLLKRRPGSPPGRRFFIPFTLPGSTASCPAPAPPGGRWPDGWLPPWNRCPWPCSTGRHLPFF